MRRLILITILVLTNFYLLGQVWRKYDINSLNNIAVDNQGNKWFSTYDGVYMFDNSDWTKFDITNGLATNSITSILIDKSDNKWFGSFTTDNIDKTFVTKYDGSNWTKYNVIDSSKNEDHSAIWDIKEDTLGNIWFATTSGVSMFDGINWTNFHIKDGLPSEYIRCIAIDKLGNKWFGTRKGLVKYNDKTWVTFYSPDTVFGSYANNIYSIAFDNNDDLWAGGSLGLYKLENSHLVAPNKSIFISVFKVAFDRNNVMWLGVENGFMSKGKLRITSANEGINSIAVDTNNDIWLGTYSWTVKYEDTPLILNVYPTTLQLDTIAGSKNYFVINSNTDWTLNYLHDLCEDCERLFSLSKYSGSDSDTIWVTALQNYNGYPLSANIRISEFGQTYKNVTITQGVRTNIISNDAPSINIYPNPVIDNLVIENTSQNIINKIEIYSINGVFLSLIKTPDNVFDMSGFDKGVYFIKIYSNSSIVIKRIIKTNK